jgi:Glycosyl transferases group 1/Glycosyltransferase Family 4
MTNPGITRCEQHQEWSRPTTRAIHDEPLKILMPSIVDPTTHRGGAGTVTRALLQLLQEDTPNIQIKCIAPKNAVQNFHRIRQLMSVGRSLVSALPSKAIFTYSHRFRDVVTRSIHEEKFDLILLNGADLLWLLPKLSGSIPRVLIAHNIEHRLFLSQIKAGHFRSRVLLRLLLRDWRRLRDYEIAGMRQVKNVIFLSRNDAAFALRKCPSLKILTVPPLFDYVPLQRPRTTMPTASINIGLPANFGWWPNREGLEWFLKNVFPYTDDLTRLHLFGEQSHTAAPNHPRIVKHGFLTSVHDIWSISDFMICPIFSGGGVNVKLAEAVYNSVPVLATSFSARGLPLERNSSIVLLDRAEEWIDFLRSTAAREFRAQNVPIHVSKPFAMESHIEAVGTFIREVAHNQAGLPPLTLGRVT